MTKPSSFTPLAALMGLALCTAAPAAITYVDAQEGSSGNTYGTGRSLGTTG